MRSPSVLYFAQRKRATGVSAMKKASAYGKTSVAGKTKDAARIKTKAG